MIEIKKISFLEAGVCNELLFGRREIVLPCVCRYHNVADFNITFAKHLDRDVYVARKAIVERVCLVQLPKGTTVHGNLNYVTTIEDSFISEQYHHAWLAEDAPHRQALASIAPVIDISEPALLVARYGEWTWGHWLGELLPRAVAAENAAPGKYKFVVPIETTDPTNNFSMVRNVINSLVAYGIELDRLIRIDRTHRYRFDNLSAVTSIWAFPYTIHPSALSLMRNSIRVRIPTSIETKKRIAMLRGRGHGRTIINADEVLQLLESRGFGAVDIGSLSFAEQVSIFRNSETVFGVLGSSLTGLIYSPHGVKCLSVAPGDWGDRFFYALLQAHNGLYSDIRGTPDPPENQQMSAPFSPDISEISRGLDELEVLASST